MVNFLPPNKEYIRRLGRKRKTLIAERVFHVNRIKVLLFIKAFESTSLCVVIVENAWRSFELGAAG
ncbi:hypothetical protein A8M32_08605 [Sinorhizobium alkalisoli]|uniref:Uncharacterized protein n=1 Tax=Sinorhizobium alkalisoli TaxID=1752398 RepID=A0A1E3VDV7_9HYPH|nr:hypothetical protein A8M32_08605 [Sinorhizobium alkalisoli]QFI70476.1 hypothetical protein EKH55_5602 [Sinorhizobium alkalisoli]